MDYKEAVEKFVNYKGNRFEVASKTYKSYILAFFKYIKKELGETDNDDILSFQAWMKQNKYADSTRALYSTALREFFKFTCGRGWSNKVNREEITINKVYPKVMPYAVQSDFLSLCDITKDNPVQKLAVKILWLCGCRVTELITLKKADVDLLSKGAVVRNLKHDGHESTKFIQWDDETNNLLINVMALNTSEWVFYSRKSKEHLTARQVQRWFENFKETLGITKEITPHSMRRGFVKDNLNIGLPLPHLQQMGGWKSLEALQKYTKRLDNDIKDIATEALRKRKALSEQKQIFELEKIKLDQV